MGEDRFHLLMVVTVDSHLVRIPLQALCMLVTVTEDLLTTYYRTVELLLDDALFKTNHWESLMNGFCKTSGRNADIVRCQTYWLWSH